jgi:hypothetical protein
MAPEPGKTTTTLDRHRAEVLEDPVAHLVGPDVPLEQDSGRRPFVLAHEAEQDVFRADVVVAERESLAQRELEDLLRAR